MQNPDIRNFSIADVWKAPASALLLLGIVYAGSRDANGQKVKPVEHKGSTDNSSLIVNKSNYSAVQIDRLKVVVNFNGDTSDIANITQPTEVTIPTETPTSGDGGKNKPEQSPSVTPTETETQPTVTATETPTGTPDATAITAETPRTVEDFKGKILTLDKLAKKPLVLSNMFPGRVKFYTKDKRDKIIPYGGLTAIGTHRSIECLNMPYTDFYDYGSGNSVIVFGSNDNTAMTQEDRDRIYRGDLGGNSLHSSGYSTLESLGLVGKSYDPNQEIKVLILNHS